jgi:hypothetical protein
MQAKRKSALVLENGNDSGGRSLWISLAAPAGTGDTPRYFTSHVSPARSNLCKSPAPRFAITSLIC